MSFKEGRIGSAQIVSENIRLHTDSSDHRRLETDVGGWRLNRHGSFGPAYLRLSITDQCNLRCSYCRPVSAAGQSSLPQLADDSELLDLVRLVSEETGIHKLRLSGGEPLLCPGLPKLIEQIRSMLPELTLGVTTNGTLLAEAASELRSAGLNSVNVSLDSLDPDRFYEVAGSRGLEATLQGIRVAVEAGFSSVKINAVLIRRVNGDQLHDLVRFAAETGCEIRFIELMPYGHGAELFESDYLAAEEALGFLKHKFQYLGPVEPTGTSSRHRFFVDGSVTVVGMITPVSEPFCSRCDRLRVNRVGRLYVCLRQPRGVDLLTPLRSGDEPIVRRRIREAISSKRDPGVHWPDRRMVTIGG